MIDSGVGAGGTGWAGGEAGTIVEVTVDLGGTEVLAGTLLVPPPSSGGDESQVAFAYDDSYLAAPGAYALDPALPLRPGPATPPDGKTMFNGLRDGAPDAWGRELMTRAEERRALQAGTAPRRLGAADFLLATRDDLREGATRFRLPAGPHLAASDEGVPGLAELGVLLRASDELVAGGVTDDDAFAALVAAGSSIGGAQPKAAVRGWGEAPAIAKFTRPALGTEPHWDVVGWERVTQLLARRCGLDTVPSGLVRAGGTRADGTGAGGTAAGGTAAGGSAAGRGKEGGGEGAGGGNVFVIERFDRCAGRRIGFATAFTMLGAIERDDAHSYLEIVEVLRAHSPRPQRDLEELFRRVVFSILVANTDEHLRNHGFLRRGGGWALSPLYDVNPNPRSEGLLMTAVDEADHSASIELAASSAESYGLSARRGCEVIGEVEAGTRPWREVAASLCLRPEEVELMAAAFESPERGVAARLAGLAGRAAGGPGGRGATGNRSSRAMALDTGSATALGGASDAGSATA